MHTWIAFFLFWGIQVVIILKGVEGIKYLETWSAPLLLGGGLVLLVWAAWRAGGLGHVLDRIGRTAKATERVLGHLSRRVDCVGRLLGHLESEHSRLHSLRTIAEIADVGPGAGTAADDDCVCFHRRGRNERDVLIYGVAIPNPVDLMARFDSVLIILFATAVIFAAQLTTNMAANVVSPSNDFSNLNPRLISYVTGGLITAVIGILMMPWKLMASMGAYIFTWLIGYSGLMGAIAGSDL